MDANLQMQQGNIQIPVQDQKRQEEWDKKQKNQWQFAEDFHEISGKTEITSFAYANDYDQLDMQGLFSILAQDQKSKSPLFISMQDSLRTFLNAISSKGTYQDKNGNTKTLDYAQLLFEARQSTRNYVNTQNQNWHFFENGKRRLDVAKRIDLLLDQLQDRVAKQYREMTEKEKRMAAYKSANLTDEQIEEQENMVELCKKTVDLKSVIETGDFGPKLSEKEQDEAEKNWVAGDYKDELLKLIGPKAKPMNKAERNKILAKLMDKNNLLVANKMTVSILVESDEGATLNMPWMKELLKTYVADRISKKDFVNMEPQLIADKTRDLIAEFKEGNKGLLKKCEQRRNALYQLVPMDENADQKKA